MKKISADHIFPVSSEPIPDGVVILDDHGKILALDHRENHDPASLEVHRGVIVPGPGLVAITAARVDWLASCSGGGGCPGGRRLVPGRIDRRHR